MIRDGRQDMEGLVREFNDAVVKAEEGLATVRAAAQEGGEALQARTDAADRLADDLAFLMKKGDITINKLEEIIKRSRNPLYRSSSQQDREQQSGLGRRSQRPDSQPQDIAEGLPGTAARRPGNQDGAAMGRSMQPKKEETTVQPDQGQRTITGAVPGSLPLRSADGDGSPPADGAGQGEGRPALSNEETKLLKILQGMR